MDSVEEEIIKEKRKDYEGVLKNVAEYEKDSDILRHTTLGNIPIVFNHFFKNSKEIRIYDKNFSKDMWNYKPLAKSVKNLIWVIDSFKILLNEPMQEHYLSKLIEETNSLGHDKLDIRYSDEHFAIKVSDDNKKEIGFFIGDNNKPIFYGDYGASYSFNNSKLAKKLIDLFDSAFEEAKKTL